MKKTIFLDIDGCVLKHHGNITKQMLTPPELLHGVIDKFNEWDMKGYKIILTTGRKECMRKMTEEQLFQFGLFYDQLIMGIERGERVIINDRKPNNDMVVCSAIEINRNEGLENIDI